MIEAIASAELLLMSPRKTERSYKRLLVVFCLDVPLFPRNNFGIISTTTLAAGEWS